MSDTANVVKAGPTKEFFIEMLISDISLQEAITELVDNSFDAAKKIGGMARYDGLEITLQLSDEAFAITDNCGGMPVETARNVAFRFGRPKGAVRLSDYSVGRFGVGMKRAMFKIGSHFDIVSRTNTSHFEIDLDVDEWSTKTEWDFEFTSVQEDSVQSEPAGTQIRITKLHDTVRQDVTATQWCEALYQHIAEVMEVPLSRGLSIKLNDQSITPQTSEILFDAENGTFTPATDVLSLDGVEVKLIAGVGDPDRYRAGWSIYCNGRLLLGHDKGQFTGWGENGVPLYHGEFSRFRGYVFFEAEDPTKLPMNTTKSGVDVESKVYRGVKLVMQGMARGVIDYLNALNNEIGKEEQLLLPIVEHAEHKIVRDVVSNDKMESHPFTFTRYVPKVSRVQRIQYDVDRDRADTAKRALGVTSLKDVGLRTFEYYYHRECED